PTFPCLLTRERTSYDVSSMPGTLGTRTAWQTSRSRSASILKGPSVTRTTLSFARTGVARHRVSASAAVERRVGMHTSRRAAIAPGRGESIIYRPTAQKSLGRGMVRPDVASEAGLALAPARALMHERKRR